MAGTQAAERSRAQGSGDAESPGELQLLDARSSGPCWLRQPPDQRLCRPARQQPSMATTADALGPRLRVLHSMRLGGWRWRTAASTSSQAVCLSLEQRVLMLCARPAGWRMLAPGRTGGALQKQPQPRRCNPRPIRHVPAVEPVVADDGWGHLQLDCHGGSILLQLAHSPGQAPGSWFQSHHERDFHAETWCIYVARAPYRVADLRHSGRG